MNRREFLGAAFAAPFAVKAAAKRGYRAVLTTDFAVPHEDPDDYYDVLCAVALGFHGVILDPKADTPAAAHALREVGARQLDPGSIRDADAVVVVGGATHAARHYRGQRVVLFAGDAQRVPEMNELLDPDAYAFLLRKEALWVPCFDGGVWQSSSRASYAVTTDDQVIGGTPHERWFRRYCGDAYGARNLYAGAYLGFAFRDRIAGAQVGPFMRGPDLAGATRALLTGYRSR